VARSITIPTDDRLKPHLAAYASIERSRRLTTLIGVALLAGATVLAGWMGEVNLELFWSRIGEFGNYIGRLFFLSNGKAVITDVYGGEDSWFWGFFYWLKKIGETLVIAYLGTVLGFIGGFLLCFFAAANLTPAPWMLFVTRRYLEFCRTVPEIVFALIFVVAFGLGPIPGVLAIGIHTTGALGKLFSEVAENIDMKPVEGLASTGGSWAETMRFAAVPQVLSNFVSYTLLRFEINVRSAAIMGFVGAGGIGQDLIESIRKFYYSDVSAILLLLVITVIIIDMATERVRHSLISHEGRA